LNTPIQFLLICFVSALGLLALAKLGKPIASRLTVLTLVSLGVLFVLHPELTTSMANSVGVGRGSDLIIYFGGLTLVYLLLLSHLRSVTLERQLRSIVRHLAIHQATGPHNEVESDSR